MIESEIANLQECIKGWAVSLANPDLPIDARSLLEGELTSAVARIRELKAERAAAAVVADRIRQVADSATVADRLNRLGQVLSSHNPTRTGIELALHIEGIHVHPDERVVVRTCKLGGLAGGVELVATATDEPDRLPSGPGRGTPRRRSARRLDTADAGPELRQLADHATDVTRFGGLGPEWFTEDVLRMPQPICWAEANAAAVARRRGDGLTIERLATEFGKSQPTIRKALRLAADADPAAKQWLGKIPQTRWPDTHFAEVSALRQAGWPIAKIAAHFDKCEPTIRTALALAESAAAQTPDPSPDSTDAQTGPTDDDPPSPPLPDATGPVRAA